MECHTCVANFHVLKVRVIWCHQLGAVCVNDLHVYIGDTLILC
jgi:hypothetical protein